MQGDGSFEAELQCRRPDWKLSFRNLGWSGDDVHGIARKRFDSPEDGFQRLLKDVETADPTVVLVAYGSAEASDGEPAISQFQAGLKRLVSELQKQDRRLILLSPVAMPGFRVPGYDQSISQCRAIIQRVGEEQGIPVVSPNWVPDDDDLTEDRLLPNVQGYAALGNATADRLVGGAPCDVSRLDLRRRISAKNQLFFHRYRPQNETYLFLFRKHEQGNNAAEIPQFDPLILAADKAIWEAAAH